MLTQEDLVGPNMSGEGSLERSSWKAEAIRRGDLKISGPIPITEDIPLSEEEEREYAEKHQGTVEPLEQEVPPQPTQPPPAPPPAEPSIHDKTHEANDNAGEERPSTPEERHEHHELQHKPSFTGIRETSETQRPSSIEPASHGAPSPFPSILDSSTKTTPQKKKRKSGLRNVFRKMFGRKSREEEETISKGHSHTVSDPGLLRQSPPRRANEGRSRISAIPVQEPKPLNPLGQHLPFPMNVNAPQEASPPHEYLTFEIPSPQLARRRATLPGVLLANAETQSLDERVKKLETWEEQRDNESIPSPQIGIALSSPPHAPQGFGQSIQSKRRSRSAGALRDLIKSRPSVERRRSAEIRYWRTSYASGSVYSSNTPRPQTARTVETVRSADTHDTAAKIASPLAKELDVTNDPPVAQHDQDISQIPLPVEAFNFGNLRSGFSDDEDSEEPAAPPPRSENRLSMEERVHQLEENMRSLETSVRRISGRTNRQTIILENAPKGRRSRNRSSSTTSDRQGSYHSKDSSHTLHSRPVEAPPSPGLPPLSAVDDFSKESERRETMIALSQRPSTSRQPGTTDSIATLYEALQHERTARKALEVQVSTLQRELYELHTLVNKIMRTVTSPTSYPTPSPDGIVASHEERLSTPRASTQPDPRERVLESRYRPTSAGESSGRGEWSVTSSREDVTSPEDWATPKEESGFGSGFFGGGPTRSRSDLRDEEMF